MALTPDFNGFETAYLKGENQIVFTRLAADLDTPVSLMLKLTGAARDAFMLESVTGGEVPRSLFDHRDEARHYLDMPRPQQSGEPPSPI